MKAIYTAYSRGDQLALSLNSLRARQYHLLSGHGNTAIMLINVNGGCSSILRSSSSALS